MNDKPMPSSRLVVATVGAASGQLIGANNRRRGLFISSHATSRVTISDGTPVVLDSGFTVQAGGVPVHICAYLHGNWIQNQLQAIASIAGTPVAMIEVVE